ncbi:MAG: MG2 domain-containing protein, partial [Saprospiraceae bacterium]
MKKISLLLFVLIISMAFVITPETNPVLRFIKNQIRFYSENNQFENLYLQTDKPLYEQGETVWFSAFVRNATDFKNAESEIVYVELINPKGAIVVKRNLLMENQVFTGDFQITNDFVGGIYKIKAYTKWMQDVQQEAFTKEITIQDVVLPNLLMDLEFQRKAYGKGDKAFADLELKTLKNQPLANMNFKYIVQFDGKTKGKFTQKTDKNGKATIQIDLPIDLNTNDGLLNIMIDYEGQTESISRAIPIVLNDIDVQFLPESGNLLANISNNIAFKAVNEFGKAADIEGAIYNQKNELITYFSSYHLGMGKFELNTQKNEKYYAKILSPRGIDKKYELP